MSEPYKSAKSGRLIFKGGDLAAVKSIDKKKKKKKSKKHEEDDAGEEKNLQSFNDGGVVAEGGPSDLYTIDAAKKMKYEELFPVETMKFGYDPANKSRSGARSVEEALDDRVKKKADRYCK
ncbi:Protein FAM32A protein [Dioscorea alata]|uniref:Protein FAM32A protein n=1 Tax=Dioscorea alata TaxID=55571 RepID=A0ACB7UUT3_DIOAL|nr:Protein FAM32A protein [Dioscorea alata]